MNGKIKCLSCGETLESTYRHNFRMCKCENQSYVDGGSCYTRIGGKDLSLIKVLQSAEQEVNK